VIALLRPAALERDAESLTSGSHALTAQRDELVLRAPVHGVIATPRLDERIGARP
jgi:hypothetical protein